MASDYLRWKDLHEHHGLEKDWLGGIFHNSKGFQFKILGISTHPSRPITCKGLHDGKKYIFDARTIVNRMRSKEDGSVYL